MSQHLSPETIEQLEARQLRGAEYAAVLLHLNSCEECRQLLIVPSKEEIEKRILGDDAEKDEDCLMD